MDRKKKKLPLEIEKVTEKRQVLRECLTCRFLSVCNSTKKIVHREIEIVLANAYNQP